MKSRNRVTITFLERQKKKGNCGLQEERKENY